MHFIFVQIDNHFLYSSLLNFQTDYQEDYYSKSILPKNIPFEEVDKYSNKVFDKCKWICGIFCLKKL